jgi:hypothetical protein
MKRKTSKHRRSARHQNVLQVRVMSPRIAWFGFLRCSIKLAKVACLLAALTGIGWGVWRGVQHAFYQNTDFALRVIDLNQNPVIDEIGVAETAGIDLQANPNLFNIDVDALSEKLAANPAIIDARVERHLPGTLVVRVIPRSPKAWISCPADGFENTRREGGLLVDHDDITFPCPAMMVEVASKLPVIDLPALADHPLKSGVKLDRRDLHHCFGLLDSAHEADAQAYHWIDSIQPANDWSLRLVTRDGTTATFGLDDHARQIDSLRAALDHAGEKGYLIDTINLIPKYNIPITVRNGSTPPKAIPVSAPETTDRNGDRRARDVKNLLNRN